MNVEIRCIECKGVYNFIRKNYSAFLDAQFEDVKEQIPKAVSMIKLARLISGIVSDEESFKKKKK